MIVDLCIFAIHMFFVGSYVIFSFDEDRRIRCLIIAAVQFLFAIWAAWRLLGAAAS